MAAAVRALKVVRHAWQTKGLDALGPAISVSYNANERMKVSSR